MNIDSVLVSCTPVFHSWIILLNKITDVFFCVLAILVFPSTEKHGKVTFSVCCRVQLLVVMTLINCAAVMRVLFW